ncbi:structural protein P5 [Stenotrophomonas sp.]|uniref:structural protein P5 n=1 Tax=Stenotrophomonas sp. TaxID=69392 RepID=UPI0028AD601E|nr:structural protein P5 [Stenotrophomonas sp.]
MSTKPEPRGVRSNNPGNIDRTKTVWQGEDRSAAALRREPRFCVFETPQAGFRALAKTLLTYQSKHGLRTVRDMINRWAPPVENNTEAYIAQVAREVGVGSREIVSLSKQVPLQRMVTAIARHENGGLFWDESVIEAGVRQALA